MYNIAKTSLCEIPVPYISYFIYINFSSKNVLKSFKTIEQVFKYVIMFFVKSSKMNYGAFNEIDTYVTKV